MPLRKHILTKGVDLQFRLARSVRQDLLDVICSVCCRTPEILECYLLDMKRPEDDEVMLAVALHTETRKHFESAADRMAIVLNEYPQDEEQTVLIEISDMRERFLGHECYKRSDVG